MLCVDIGSHSIKLCDLADGGLGWQLAYVSVLSLPPGLVSAGRIADPAEVVAHLRHHVDAADLRGRDVALAISSPTAQLHTLRVPRMADDELAEALGWELEALLPYDAADAYVAWRAAADADGALELEVSTDTRPVIDAAIDVVRRARLNVAQVAIAPAALARWYDRSNSAQRAVVANIGAEATTLLDVEGGRVIAAARAASGGQHITKAVQQHLDCDATEAERVKLVAFADAAEQREGPYRGSSLGPAVRTIVEDAAAALAASLADAIDAAFDSAHAKKIWLSGGSAAIPSVAGGLRQRFPCPVDQWLPYGGLRPRRGVDGAALLRIGARFGVGFGLAVGAPGLRVPGLGRTRWWNFWKR